MGKEIYSGGGYEVEIYEEEDTLSVSTNLINHEGNIVGQVVLFDLDIYSDEAELILHLIDTLRGRK